MSDNVSLIEDGVAPPGERTRSRPSWIVGVAGFVLGLGLGVLVVGPSPEKVVESGVPPLTAPTGEPPVVTLDGEGAAPGVIGVIPDFPDAIVAIAATSGSALQRVLWPNGADKTITPMTGGEGVELDSGAQFIAFSQDIPGVEGDVLSMGRFHTMQAVAPGVTSYAWHDSTPGWLAYTTVADGATRLFDVKADLVANDIAEIDDTSATIVGWGDWGWAIQKPGEVLLLTRDGQFKDSEVGTGLATLDSGWVFVMEGTEPKLVSGGGGVRRIPASLDIGPVFAAEFSPDGDRVLIAGTRKLAVLDIDTGDAVDLAGPPVASFAWSSDSRFVLVGSESGVTVFDLVTGTARPILTEHDVVAVGVVALGPP